MLPGEREDLQAVVAGVADEQLVPTHSQMVCEVEQPLPEAVAKLQRLRIQGDDLSPADRRTGLLMQSPHLFPHLDVSENLTFGFDRAPATIDLDEVVDWLDIRPLLNRRVRHLSGGEQQRVAVARALINKPKLLLADEPSGNLDSKTADQLHKLFISLRENFDQTIVFVTHNKELAALGDRSLQLVDGQWS